MVVGAVARLGSATKMAGLVSPVLRRRVRRIGVRAQASLLTLEVGAVARLDSATWEAGLVYGFCQPSTLVFGTQVLRPRSLALGCPCGEGVRLRRRHPTLWVSDAR